eukprot:4880974-Prymnesium_polylepis.1
MSRSRTPTAVVPSSRRKVYRERTKAWTMSSIWRHLAEHAHLARELPVAVVEAVGLLVALPGRQVRVVADLEQRRQRSKRVGATREHPGDEVALEELLVLGALLVRQLAEEHLLRLVGQVELDVGLQPPQQVWPDQVAQDERALVRGLHLEVGRVGIGTGGDGYRKLLLEGGQCAQLAREDKVEERPELRQPVLDGRAREDDAVGRVEALADEGHLRVRVADLVALVEDHVLPLLIEQRRRVGAQHL